MKMYGYQILSKHSNAISLPQNWAIYATPMQSNVAYEGVA